MIYQSVSRHAYLFYCQDNIKEYQNDRPQIFPEVKYRHYVDEDTCVLEFPHHDEYVRWMIMYG